MATSTIKSPTELVRVAHTGTEVTQSASTQGAHEDTFTKSGYFPIGIVGITLAGTGVGQIVPYTYRLTDASMGSATVKYGIRNNNPSTDIAVTPTFHILWHKK